MQRQLRLVIYIHLHGLRGGEGAASSEEEGRGLLLQRNERGGGRGEARVPQRKEAGGREGERGRQREREGGRLRCHAVQSMQC